MTMTTIINEDLPFSKLNHELNGNTLISAEEMMMKLVNFKRGLLIRFLLAFNRFRKEISVPLTKNNDDRMSKSVPKRNQYVLINRYGFRK